MTMTNRSFSRTGAVLAVVAVLALPTATPAIAAYRAAAGDTIEVAVRGFPELRQRVAIGTDGTITLAAGGAIPVAGLTEAEIAARVRQALTATAFRQRAADGHDDAIALEPDEITASIAEYRPVYVTGDVDKSGEQPFRMALNVRQAIALAGGTGPSHSRKDDQILPADLHGEAEALWAQDVRAHARIWRLSTELGTPVAFDRSLFATAPVSEATITRSLDLEAEMLRAVGAARAREDAFLKDATAKIGATIDLVGRQQADEVKGTEADVQDLQTVLDLMGKGNVTSSRVNDARRAVLLASTRKLQTAAALLQLKRQQDELVQQFTRTADGRRLTVVQELQAAEADRDATEAKIRSIEQKLRILGRARVSGADAIRRPTIAVFRTVDHVEQRIDATEQTELEPGDVVEVAFPSTPTLQSLH